MTTVLKADGYQVQQVGETLVLSVFVDGATDAHASYALPLRGAYELGTKLCISAARQRAQVDGTGLDRVSDADSDVGLSDLADTDVEVDNASPEEREAARRELAASRAKALGKKGGVKR